MIDVIHVLNSTLNACLSGHYKITYVGCSSFVQFVGMKMTIMLGWSFQSRNSLLLCWNQQSNNHTIFWCFGKLKCSICECKYGNIILWANLFVASKVDQWFALKAKYHQLLMHMNFPSLFGGSVLCMVFVKTTWKGKNNPSMQMMKQQVSFVSYLQSLIPWCVLDLYFPMSIVVLLT